MLRTALLAGAATALLPHSAFAADAPPAGTATAPPAPDNYHSDDGQEIIITGFRRNREDILSGTAVLSGETLTREMRTTIGDTLAHQAGVSATSFGPNASRPVLRGMQGDRIRVLTDGIGSLDASSTSVDHAVAINPLTADRVEVLRGPAALLFGSSAIGGVVNVIDARIPRRIPDEPVHVEALATYGTAADERSVNGALDVPLGGHFVMHVDGNYSKTDDLRVGGFLLTPALRTEAAASADPAIKDLAALKDRLPNSAARTWEVAAGAAYVSDATNVGVSFNHYDSLYGIPIRFSLDPSVEAEAPRIRIKQDRVDGRAEIDTGSGFVDSLRLRAGYSDYRHNEIEDDGTVATTFGSKGFEARAEAVQTTRKGWGGGFGAQYFHRNFDVVGEEKFLPRNSTSQVGLFTVQNLEVGGLKVEAGARYEHSDVTAEADADLGNSRLKRTFDAFSGSLGASYAIAPNVRIGLNASHSERAPSAEELYANGPHAGTQAFEIGDPDLKVEKSWGIEGTMRASGDGYSLSASLYHNWFSNFIYQQQTGAIEDDLPVFQNLQASARHFGFEVEGSLRVAQIGGTAIQIDALADYVRATIKGVGPAPRIPPLRLLGGIEAQAKRVQGRVEVEWVDDQNRLAALETPTNGYTMVNASLTFHPLKDNPDTTITLSANNIFDVEARRHASFLKDYAPLAGRDVRITAHLRL